MKENLFQYKNPQRSPFPRPGSAVLTVPSKVTRGTQQALPSATHSIGPVTEGRESHIQHVQGSWLGQQTEPDCKSGKNRTLEKAASRVTEGNKERDIWTPFLMCFMGRSYVSLPSLRTDCTTLSTTPLSMLYPRLHKYPGDFQSMAGGRKGRARWLMNRAIHHNPRWAFFSAWNSSQALQH